MYCTQINPHNLRIVSLFYLKLLLKTVNFLFNKIKNRIQIAVFSNNFVLTFTVSCLHY